MILSDLNEVKKILAIPVENTTEDVQLSLYLEFASGLIEEVLNRSLFFRSRTEYYDGTGTQRLNLRSRPVYTTPAIEVWHDRDGWYGSNSDAFQGNPMTYGRDFCLVIDQDNGTSRSGILIRINDVWPRFSYREQGYLSPFVKKGMGNIKVIYTAGYTVDDLPAPLRAACDLLVARYRYVFPLGMELSSESYEERSISNMANARDYLLSLIKPMVYPYRNWSW